MNHLTIKRAYWVNVADDSGKHRYGLETNSGDRSIAWLAGSLEEAKAKAEELAKERGVPAELIDQAAAISRFAADEVRIKAELAAKDAALQIITPSADWSVAPDATGALGIAGVTVNLPPADGRILASERLAARAAETALNASMKSGDLLRMGDDAPQYRNDTFAIVNHPEHGRIAVTKYEFEALGLAEAPLAA